jgi:hypothetical protein
MLTLDIPQALRFLDALDPDGRHTLASEAPFGGRDNGPKWERGKTFEARQRPLLVKDIEERQARGSNVYYSVNRPCPVGDQKGFGGKCNVDDIVAIRALAFDIDHCHDVSQIEVGLSGALRPSFIINTGGGFHLIYLLKETISVNLYLPPKTDDEKAINKILTDARSAVTNLGNDFEALLRRKFPNLKIDSMSNVDRVMRLPGTVNYPKAEKRDRGQVEALADIAKDYGTKFSFPELRSLIPMFAPSPSATKKPYAPRPNNKWTAYKKALASCEYIRDHEPLVDNNHWYTHNVMLRLIGAIHDENEYNQLTIEEAFDCFMEAVSGGARYGVMGRGPGYFARQWKSHHPERPNYHRMSLGTLIRAAKLAGMTVLDTVAWEDDFERQLKELQELKQVAPQDIIDEFKRSTK